MKFVYTVFTGLIKAKNRKSKYMQVSQIHRYNFRVRAEGGNVFVFVFLAIVLLAALTYAVSNSGDEQASASDKLVRDDQIGRLLSQASATSGALQQMILAGANPETLYSTLDLVKPDEAAFNTSPHSQKLYHPYGGGMTYVGSTGPTDDASTIAEDIFISPGSIVENVGPTNTTVGDILFIAAISSREACERINKKVIGSTAVPVVGNSVFNALFIDSDPVVFNSAACPTNDCFGVTQLCFEDEDAARWGFYQVLLPG